MTISGGECLACGLIHAPAQSFGCERCGAFGDQLVARELAPTGRIVSRAVVHVHRFPTPKTPFTVLDVALDAGPALRGIAVEGDAAAYAIGAAVVAQAAGEDGLIRLALASAAPA